MCNLLLFIGALVASLLPSDPGDTFDEGRAIAEYEAFMFAYFAREWGPAEAAERFRTTADSGVKLAAMDAWPVDPVRGAWVNGGRSLSRYRWVGVGSEGWPGDDSIAEEKFGAFVAMSYHFMHGFNDAIAPVTCVSRPDVSSAYLGAAACYFAVRAEYHEPGFWVALREVDGRVVVAGIAQHKRALESPEKDKKLTAFLKGIEKRFGPTPGPKAPTRAHGGR